MANIQERKDAKGKMRYRVQVRLRGYPAQCATFERITDAKKWAQQTESAIKEGRHFKTAESKKHTVAELIDRYLRDVMPQKPRNARTQTAQLLWWKEQIGSHLLADATPALLAEKRDLLLSGTTYRGGARSPSTVVRYLSTLSHAFSVAVRDWQWIEDSPFRKLSKPKQPRGRVRFLDDEERARLLKACQQSANPFLYIAVVVAISTGMRQAELMNLIWSDADLIRGRITLHQTKNGQRRTVPVSGLALSLLKELAQKRSSDTLFLFPGQNRKQPIDLRHPWELALQQANIRDFKWHDLRHCCASYMVMSGASLVEVAEVLGHRDLAMARRYSHLSESHTASVVSKMNEKIFG